MHFMHLCICASLCILCFFVAHIFVLLCGLPRQGGEAGRGGDGVETEVATRQLQSEILSFEWPQVSAGRLVDDLSSTFFSNALANHHQSRQTLAVANFRRAAIAIKQ